MLPVQLVASATLLMLPLQSDSRAQIPASLELKRTIVNQVVKTLKDKAFVLGANFSKSEEVLDVKDSEIAGAATDEAFVTLMNARLQKFGVSHLDLRTPSFVAAYRRGASLGTGIAGKINRDEMLIESVVPGSPAAAAGIKPWDVLTAIDGKPVKSTFDLIGRTGQRRTLQIRRNRRRVIKEVTYRPYKAYRANKLQWLKKDTAFMSVNTFTNPTYKAADVDRMFAEASRARALVLDLRYNGGGDFDNCMHLLSHLLPPGTTTCKVVYRYHMEKAYPEGIPTDLKWAEFAKKFGEATVLPDGRKPFGGNVVVLVSGLTGSGGEVASFALKDLKRATVVGHRTMGKVLIGQSEELTGGFQLHYPDGEIIAPSGRRIEGFGTTPHKELPERETLSDKDVLAVALRALAK